MQIWKAVCGTFQSGGWGYAGLGGHLSPACSHLRLSRLNVVKPLNIKQQQENKTKPRQRFVFCFHF